MKYKYDRACRMGIWYCVRIRCQRLLIERAWCVRQYHITAVDTHWRSQCTQWRTVIGPECSKTSTNWPHFRSTTVKKISTVDQPDPGSAAVWHSPWTCSVVQTFPCHTRFFSVHFFKSQQESSQESPYDLQGGPKKWYPCFDFAR